MTPWWWMMSRRSRVKNYRRYPSLLHMGDATVKTIKRFLVSITPLSVDQKPSGACVSEEWSLPFYHPLYVLNDHLISVLGSADFVFFETQDRTAIGETSWWGKLALHLGRNHCGRWPHLLDSWSWTLHLGNHQQTSWMFLLFCFLSSSYIKAQSPHYLYFRTHGYLLDSTLVSVTVEFLDPFSAVPVLHASLSWFMTLQFWSTVTVALLDFAVLCALLLCCITPLSWRIVVFFVLFCFFPPFSPSTAGVFLARMTKIYSCTFI